MKVTIIGCGNMGSAIARSLAKTQDLYLYDRNPEKCEGLARELGAKVGREGDITILAVKPKDLSAMPIQGILVSVLAGATLSRLQDNFPEATVVRMMPNMPIETGDGVVGLSAADSVDKEPLNALFSPLGTLFWLSEEKLDMLTAIAGSGPAYVYLFLDALTEGGLKMGLSEEEAAAMARRTIAGAIAFHEKTKTPIDELTRRICSPGGTTRAALDVMEKAQVKEGIIAGVLAAQKRTQEMA